jgi:pimeloyl-ACP methyl ester carboxylesterase
VALTVRGNPLAALQSGPLDGAPVLLVPGFTGSKEDFGPILDPLGDAGFAVTAIDLPGQFESPGPDSPHAYYPDRLGEVVCALARRLGGGVRLLGHSFGGLVARAAVIADASPFRSLVLLGSGPAALGGQRRRVLDRLQPVLERSGVAGVFAELEAADWAAPDYVGPPTDVAEFLRRRFLAGAPAMLQGMADALRSEPDRVAELASAGRPVLVAHGVRDDAWPPAVQAEMAERLAAKYVVIAGAAHSPAVEAPRATVEALLGFWR